METKKTKTLKSFEISAFRTWFLKHTYGFLQAIFFILLALSAVWMYYYGDFTDIYSRSLCCDVGGYFVALMPPFFLAFFPIFAGDKWNAFIKTVSLGFLLAQVWFLYWGFSYILPFFIALLLTCFYKKIRPDDNIASRVDIIAACILYWLIPLCAAVTVSYFSHKTHLKQQEYARQAIEVPVIKAIDSKGSYVYTEEYGIEKMYNHQEISAGSMIH